MLQFIFGRTSSGKTYEVISRAAEVAKQGGQPIILVPEQNTFQCEKQVLNTFGEELSSKITVLSFTRVCDAVERVVGGVCGRVLSDCDKIIFMKKSLRFAKDGLKVWKKYTSSAGFASKMTETIDEFKAGAVTADNLLNAADCLGEDTVRAKIEDISLIYKTYDSFVSERFIDNSDRLTKLYDRLNLFEFFRNKTVFIDSFGGFMGQQYKIIERILSQSENVTITLDGSRENDVKGIFENTNTVFKRISQIASNHSVKILPHIFLDLPRYESEGIGAVEEFLYSGKKNTEILSDVTVCCANTIFDEAQFVARTIRKTVREQGARYKDFVVIARDSNAYQSAIKNAMEKNGISCFLDERVSLSETPVAATVIAAAELMRSITTERVLKFHKSGLDVLSIGEISELENYAFIWNIDGEMWTKEWNMDPNGLTKEELNEKKTEKLNHLNDLRKKAIGPILKARKIAGDTAKQKVEAIFDLLQNCNAAKSFKELCDYYKSAGQVGFADVIRQSWDSVISVFDSIVTCFGEENISVSEFCDSLKTSLSLGTVGVAPQMIDAVTFGSADRIRPSRPKYAFIVGANQGVFPRGVVSNGILSMSDRSKLIENGIDIVGKTVYDTVNEEYLVYKNVCCPSEKLFISYSTSIGGKAAEPSLFLSDIMENFELKTVAEPDLLCSDSIPETRESAFSLFCRKCNTDISGASNLFTALCYDSEYLNKIKQTASFSQKPYFSISADTAQKLFTKKLRISATKLEDFFSCKFKYFCKYGLNVNPLTSAGFDASQRGTIIHYVLQRIIEVHKKGIAELDLVQIESEVRKYTKEYIDGVVGFSSVDVPEFKLVKENTIQTLIKVCAEIAEEFSTSDFEPVACELYIGEREENAPKINIPVDDIGTISVSGSVDRIDKYDCYIRVVDYKTGIKTFHLPDIVYGLNMQMLLYLYAVCEDDDLGGLPAGVLYKPAFDKNAKIVPMNGVLLDDDDILYRMDSNENSKYLPKRKSDSFLTATDFQDVFAYIRKMILNMGRSIYGGQIEACPVESESNSACRYCDFKKLCMLDDTDIKQIPVMSSQDIMSEIRKGEE